MARKKEGKQPETEFIYRPFITLRNGKVLWAHQVGKKAFRIPVKDKNQGK